MAGTNFRATVNATGDKLHAPDKAAMLAALAKWASQSVIVTIETADPVARGWRAYYFKVVVEAIRNKWTEDRGVPYSKGQVHEILKRHFIGVVPDPMDPYQTVAKGTSDDDFTNEKMIEFIEEVCAYAAQELHLNIPPPESRR